MSEPSAREVIATALDAQAWMNEGQAEILTDIALSALAAEGFTVARLDQVGEWCDLHGLCESRNVEPSPMSGGSVFDSLPDGTPVYVVAPTEQGTP